MILEIHKPKLKSHDTGFNIDVPNKFDRNLLNILEIQPED
jgi:hypothetical protein